MTDVKNKKKEILMFAESTAKAVTESGSGGFASFILNIIDFVDKQKKSEHEKMQQLCKILYNVKKSNIETLGGGESLKNSYVKFIDDYLQIKNVNDEYAVMNKTYSQFSLKELHYIFAWVRRLTKGKSGDIASDTDNSRNKHSVESSKSNISENDQKHNYKEHRNENRNKSNISDNRRQSEKAHNKKNYYNKDTEQLRNTALADQLKDFFK